MYPHLVLLLLFTIDLSAQEPPTPNSELYKTNCGIIERMSNLSEEEKEEIYNKTELFLEELPEIRDRKQKQAASRNSTAYTIPVIVHHIYGCEEGPENISRDRIEDAISKLNEDFQGTTAENNQCDWDDSAYGSLSVQFRLAEKDPNGNPTDGVNKVRSTIGYHGYGSLQQLGEFEQWWEPSTPGGDNTNVNQYMNLYIMQSPVNNGSSGVANYPETSIINPLEDQVCLAYWATAPDDPDYDSYFYVLAHEVGHWLGLRHIWGDGNNCADLDNFRIDDFDHACTSDYYNDFNDTTPTLGNSGVDICADSGLITCSYPEDCDDYLYLNTQPDMLENYMDYSGNNFAFTQGQATYMEDVLLSSSTYDRNYLIDAENLAKAFYDPAGDSAPPRAIFSGGIISEDQTNIGLVTETLTVTLIDTEFNTANDFSIPYGNSGVNLNFDVSSDKKSAQVSISSLFPQHATNYDILVEIPAFRFLPGTIPSITERQKKIRTDFIAEPVGRPAMEAIPVLGVTTTLSSSIWAANSVIPKLESQRLVVGINPFVGSSHGSGYVIFVNRHSQPINTWSENTVPSSEDPEWNEPNIMKLFSITDFAPPTVTADLNNNTHSWNPIGFGATKTVETSENPISIAPDVSQTYIPQSDILSILDTGQNKAYAYIEIPACDGNYHGWIEFTLSENSLTASNLIINYEQGDHTVILPESEYCEGYIEQSAGETYHIYIEQLNLGTIANDQNDAALTDWTAEDTYTFVRPGYSYNLEAFSTDEVSPFPYWSMYVDVNQDGYYSDSGVEKLFSGYSLQDYIGSVTIPATTSLGNTAFRIICSHYDEIEPCGAQEGYGEIEEYGLKVLSSPCVPNLGSGPVISAVNLQEISAFYSGQGNGYYDHISNYNCTLEADQSYELTVEWNGSTTNTKCMVWIDKNNDGEFTSTELIAQQDLTQTGSQIVSLHIPAHFPNGVATLRVSVLQGNNIPLDCSTQVNGTVIDYGLILESGCEEKSLHISPITSSNIHVYDYIYCEQNAVIDAGEDVLMTAANCMYFEPGTEFSYGSTVNCTIENCGQVQKQRQRSNTQEFLADLSVYPNPFEEQFHLQFTTAISGKTSINLHDIQGRIVKSIARSLELESGDHKFDVSTGDLPPGMYLINVQHENYSTTTRIVKTR